MSKISYDEKYFYIDGKKTKFMSGAIHYFRVVPEYWRDRLLKLKECGCNCVETYLAWNLHEKKEGVFDFSGMLDFGKFLDTAKELGLYAIVRPGPYICSEIDFGGFPWWLLSYPEINLRCFDDLYIEKLTPFLRRACDILRPRLITNGGNVIFIQIENEYGSYGNDKNYLNYLKNLYVEEKIDCGFLTSDGATEFLLKNGALPDVLASVNYRKDSVGAIKALQDFHGGQPGAVLELWNGKAQHWKEKRIRRDIDEVALSVKTALENAELVNLYMFHGGTTFGFMNGALDLGRGFILQMTSYDVDAPLDEYGRRTKKYYAERDVICEAMGVNPELTATDTVIRTYEDIRFIGATPLATHPELTKKHQSATPKPMEAYGQGHGYIVYECEAFIGAKGANITFPEAHDIAHLYIDGEYSATYTRDDNERAFELKSTGTHKIQILVENMGRINYGPKLKDFKGLVGDIVIFDLEYGVFSKPFGFTVYTIELDTLPEEYSGKARVNEPVFYKYTFNADKAEDTVLHFEGFTRGVAFINGFNLGRHWSVENSENKLFVPAPLIKEGENEIIVFDVLENCDKKKIKLTE